MATLIVMGGFVCSCQAAETALEGPQGCAEIAQQCIGHYKGCIGEYGNEQARCVSCPEGQAPGGNYAQCAPMEGAGYEHIFAPMALEPGADVLKHCRVWTLNNPNDLWVNGIELLSTGHNHHSTWYFVSEDDYPELEGDTWKDCLNTGFREMDAAVLGGMLSGQCLETDQYVQKYPTGVGVRIPARSHIVGLVHFVNYDTKPTDANMKMVLHTLNPADVRTRLTPFRIQFEQIALAPKATSEFTTDCDLRTHVEQKMAKALPEYKFKLHYAFPYLGNTETQFQLEVIGGKKDGMKLIDMKRNGGTTAKGSSYNHIFDPPQDLSDLQGLRVRCKPYNPMDTVSKPEGPSRELCSLVGFAETNIAFDASTIAAPLKADGSRSSTPSKCVIDGMLFDPATDLGIQSAQ